MVGWKAPTSIQVQSVTVIEPAPRANSQIAQAVASAASPTPVTPTTTLTRGPSRAPASASTRVPARGMSKDSITAGAIIRASC